MTRGKRGLPLEDIYRQLYNPHLYLRAYDRLRNNQGAMTPGTTGETVDGMSLAKIGTIIDAMRHERYRWTPVKRIYIPKKNGKLRPLGLPTWSDKLLQEVMRSILDAYYEPQFSPHSHGFRPDRGCHTALTAVQRTWKGTRWFIEGDIAACFDRLDHHGPAGDPGGEAPRSAGSCGCSPRCSRPAIWRNGRTTPRSAARRKAGWLSPILSNIYLDKLDKFVETYPAPRLQPRRAAPTQPGLPGAQPRP